jgi:elongator complex protein 3
LETRPDCINEKEIEWMRDLGATRIEMGVQSVFDDVLEYSKRGHGTKETISATKILKDAGFKINYHIMPNLPKSNPQKDLEMFEILFRDGKYQPDMLKIYPCVLTKHSMLAGLYKKNKYSPYSDKQLFDLLINIKKRIPRYVRIMRLGRDIPAPDIIAGNKISNIRQEIERLKSKKNFKCECIRCREIMNREFRIKNIELRRIDYEASHGKEIFLSFEDIKQDKLLAFLRLRIPSQSLSKGKFFLPSLENSAIIREIHTYGKLTPLSQKGRVQHFGFGKKLVIQAEKIAKNEFNLNKMAVISGVGVRNYYRKMGYRLNNTYMAKSI